MKNLLFSILLLSSITSFAQPKGMGKNDADAKKILDGVSAKFKSFKTVTAKFNLKIENSAGKVQGSKSGVVNLKGTKYRINITGQEIYSDGNTTWTYDKPHQALLFFEFSSFHCQAKFAVLFLYQTCTILPAAP